MSRAAEYLVPRRGMPASRRSKLGAIQSWAPFKVGRHSKLGAVQSWAAFKGWLSDRAAAASLKTAAILKTRASTTKGGAETLAPLPVPYQVVRRVQIVHHKPRRPLAHQPRRSVLVFPAKAGIHARHGHR